MIEEPEISSQKTFGGPEKGRLVFDELVLFFLI